MHAQPLTYLVGRRNSSVPCDIAIPTHEQSVSRKHLELTVTGDGRYYIVHVHAHNKTKVLSNGEWRTISQDYVEVDTPLRLGAYETTVRQLLVMIGRDPSPRPAPQPEIPENSGPQPGGIEWDPDDGTFIHPRHRR